MKRHFIISGLIILLFGIIVLSIPIINEQQVIAKQKKVNELIWRLNDTWHNTSPLWYQKQAVDCSRSFFIDGKGIELAYSLQDSSLQYLYRFNWKFTDNSWTSLIIDYQNELVKDDTLSFKRDGQNYIWLGDIKYYRELRVINEGIPVNKKNN